MHHQAAVGPSQAMPIYVESRGRHVGRQAARKPWDSPMAPGDAVLYAADPTPADLLIADVEHSIWIRAGMLAWNDEREEWEIVDTRQWVGGKRTPLIEAVPHNPGHWHLFHADAGGRCAGIQSAALRGQGRRGRRPALRLVQPGPRWPLAPALTGLAGPRSLRRRQRGPPAVLRRARDPRHARRWRREHRSRPAGLLRRARSPRAIGIFTSTAGRFFPRTRNEGWKAGYTSC